ncbi:MAG: acyltransferase family protein [Eubacterium sp.]
MKHIWISSIKAGKTRMNNGRIAKWDNIKFVLIFLVVLGHLMKDFTSVSSMAQKVTFFIYTFHMPAFIFISGLFSKRTINDRRFDKLVPYLYIYIFMKILIWLARFFVQGRTHFELLSEDGVPWFAMAMFIMPIMAMAVKKCHPTVVIVFSMLVGMFCQYDSNIGSFLCLSRILVFFPFFIIGYYMDINKLLLFLENIIVRIFSYVILIGYIIFLNYKIENVYWLYSKFLKGKGTFSAIFTAEHVGEYTKYGFMYRFIYYIIVLVLIMAVFAAIPSVYSVFTKLGSRTIQVFAIHFTVLYLFLNLNINGFNGTEFMNSLNPKFGMLIAGTIISAVITVVLSLGFLTPLFNCMMNPTTVKKSKM